MEMDVVDIVKDFNSEATNKFTATDELLWMIRNSTILKQYGIYDIVQTAIERNGTMQGGKQWLEMR